MSISSVNVLEAFQKKPAPQDFVIPNLLTGTVGILTSPGGTGKSMFALQMAMSVACPSADQQLLNLGISKSKSNDKLQKVVYLSLEDGKDEICRRLFYIAERRLNSELRKEISENLSIYVNTHNDKGTFDFKTYFENEAQKKKTHEKEIIELLKDTRLIIVDTLSRCHHHDENDNVKMANLISKFEKLSHSINTKPAILILHHQSKSAALNGNGDIQGAARGASALIDNPRFGSFLQTMTHKELEEIEKTNEIINYSDRKKYVKYGISKSNYGAPSLDRWFKKEDHGVLKPVYFNEKKPSEKKQKEMNFDIPNNAQTKSRFNQKTTNTNKGLYNGIENF